MRLGRVHLPLSRRCSKVSYLGLASKPPRDARVSALSGSLRALRVDLSSRRSVAPASMRVDQSLTRPRAIPIIAARFADPPERIDRMSAVSLISPRSLLLLTLAASRHRDAAAPTPPRRRRVSRRATADRMGDESDRHRRAGAPTELDAPRRAARHTPERVRDPRRRERGLVRHAALDVGPRRAPPSLSIGRTPAPPCARAVAITGRCARGTIEVRRRPGARQPSGRRGSWALRSGRRSGSSPACRWIPRAPTRRRSCAPSSRSTARWRRHAPTSRATDCTRWRSMAVASATDVLAPGWTSFDERPQYQTYDVTDLVKRGTNAVGATLGDGWYRGRLAWRDRRNTYGNRRRTSRTDRRALHRRPRADRRHRRALEGRDGTDRRLRHLQWRELRRTPRARRLEPARLRRRRLEAGTRRLLFDAELVAPLGPPIRRIEEIKPIAVLKTPAGQTVFDLGQNMVGWVRLKVRGPAGATVRLQHAEVLDKDGNFYTANLRTAQQQDSYTLKGTGDETFEPHFTFHGFRYVKVDGFPGTPARTRSPASSCIRTCRAPAPSSRPIRC